jgi:predicted  nucleic acid-binding Zn-ribbon protein
MWPVEDELQRRREKAAAAPVEHPNGRPVRWQRPADRTETLRRAEAALAEAASVHWQREHDLAEAEAAMEAVRDRQETLEQQRMHLRREKVAAEQDLAAARAAQRAALRAMIDARRTLDTAEQQLRPPDDPD